MDLFVYLDKGGFITYILLVLNIVGFSVMIWKYLEIKSAKAIINFSANEIKTAVMVDSSHPFYLTLITSECDKYIDKLDSGLNIIRNIATISPLLGLLGTVLGVLQSFESIATFGLGNPSFFSSGISVALITTIAGLIVAIPHYIGYNYFVKALDSFELDLKNKALM